MESTPTRILVLESLADGIPVITPKATGYYKQTCMVCFHRNNHQRGVGLRVNCDESNETFEVLWRDEVTEQLLRNYPKVPRVTEDAANAIALLLVRELTEFTGIEMSVLGTTIDYYLARQDQADDLIFNHAARLEVSGIFAENPQNTVNGRIRRKLARLKPEADLPTLIIVVEFSRPWSRMVEA